MSDLGKINDKTDPFSEHFRQRLIDKPTTPDANCWNEIEARLPKRRVISPVWIGLAVAASVIVAVFILNILRTENKLPDYNEVLVLKENDADKKTSEDDLIMDGGIDKEQPATTSVGGKTLAKTNAPISSSVDYAEKAEETEKTEPIETAEAKTTETTKMEELTELAELKESELTELAEREELTEQAELAKLAEKGREDNVDTQKNIDRLQYRSDENLIAYGADIGRHSEKNKNWLWMTGLGSAGGLGYLLSSLVGSSPTEFLDYAASTPEDNLTTAPGTDNEIGKETEYVPEKEITDIKTSMPVSFGVIVRKKINKTIGIETGLLYTYLSSDLKISGADYSDATLNLHYLGIPVDLIVNLWDKKQWNIYVSGGGMVEKGLQAVHKKKGIDGKERSRISGLQWSLNGGLGVSYNFYKYMNLFVEPGFSYYFDCNQPISRRTEDPFSFGIRTGIRYDF